MYSKCNKQKSPCANDQAQDQAQLQACLLCYFHDFNQGLIFSCFGHVQEDYSNLLTCLKVQIQEGLI